MRLAIEICEVGVGPSREESVADVANGALDTALLVASRDGDGPDLEMVVGSELEQLGIEANDVTVPLEHGAFQIVVEQDPRHAAEEPESVHMSAQEERHRRSKEEAEEDLPREAEHHHERPQNALGAADLKLSEVRPVDLRLLARQRSEALKRLRRLARTVATDDASEVIRAARIAARLDHLEQPARAQARVFLQLLDDEHDERICHRWPRRERLWLDARLQQDALHGRMVHAELIGNRADAPLLCVKEAEDFGLRFLWDHGATSRTQWGAARQSRSSTSSSAGTRGSSVAQTGSSALQNEQRPGSRLELSSRSFPPELISSATAELTATSACVSD